MSQQFKCDVAVYGRGLCAVMAAIGAQIALAPVGGKAMLFMPTQIMGGDAANGLMNWDTGPRDVLYRGSWLGAEFFKRVLTRYGSSNRAYRFLSRHNIEVAWEMIRYYGVQVMPNEQISAVTLAGALPAAITQLTFASGDTVVPRSGSMIVIEADTDNVDLGKLAYPAGWVIGRENQAKYGEVNAGYGQFNPISGACVPNVYQNDGVTLLDGLRLNPVNPTIGEGDGSFANQGGTANITVPAIQPPAFRAPLSRKKDGWASSWVPSLGYNQQHFQYQVATGALTFPITSSATQGVFDRNFDLPPRMAVDWAQGTWASRGQYPYNAARHATYDQMVEYEYDYFWFLANDTSGIVPAIVQTNARLYGPVTDEFFSVGPQRQPYEPYIRESYNMVAKFVMTQPYVNLGGVQRTDGISVASYSIDIHTCARWVINSTTFLLDNGFNSMPGINSPGSSRLTTPYQIAWNSCIFNETTGVTNYASAWNDGSSHIARGSNRMVPAKMYQGSAVGYIAGRSIALATPLASMNIPNMQVEMVALGHVIVPPT